MSNPGGVPTLVGVSMRARSFTSLILASAVAVAWQSVATVPYPEGYRSWTHVKSAVVSPAHANYATNGGFQHIYANEAAMRGYRTRSFPEGSVIAFDWLAMTENQGAFAEGTRRQVDV